jgi:cell division transport system permease protein
MKRPPVLARALARNRGDDAPSLPVLPSARLGGPMPWIIAIMVALCVLATGGALALANFAARSQAGLEGGLTVQIVEADPAVRDAQARKAAEILSADRSVASVRVVPKAELERLVQPWLGKDAGSDALTLPALIDARLVEGADKTALERLRASFAQAAPAARIDAQADWLGPVFGAIRALRWLAMALIVLLTLASAAAVWLAARNAFDANRATIEIVHHLGAGDAQIARLFQRSVLVDAALGGALGLGFGALALALIGGRFAALGSGAVDNGAFGPLDWVLVALVPVAMAGVALLTARRTVLTRLERML